MTVTLNWGSKERVEVGNVNFSNSHKVRSLRSVLSYGFVATGVAGETDAYVMKRDDCDFHDLPVIWNGLDAFVDMPRGRLVLLSLPYVLKEIVMDLGVSRSTGDDLWILDFQDGKAQIGSTFISERTNIPLGNLGSLVVDPNK